MIGLEKNRATFSTNQIQNSNQSRLGHLGFPRFKLFASLNVEFSLVLIFSSVLIASYGYNDFGYTTLNRNSLYNPKLDTASLLRTS